LGTVEDGSELFGAGLSAQFRLCLRLCGWLLLLLRLLGAVADVGGNTVDEVLYCPFEVKEGCSECLQALLPRKTHRHELGNFSLVLVPLGLLLGLRLFWLHLLIFLLFLLLLLLLLDRFGLALFLGLWCRFLNKMRAYSNLSHHHDEVRLFYG
jgi:hypothetical protein